MPPNRFSRHRFDDASTDDDGRLFLEDPIAFGYRDLPDNRTHVVKMGDTLWGLAGRYFKSMPRAAGFWWVITDFQPEPIHDPTAELAAGTVLVIPSVRTLQEEILSETRRTEEDT